MNALAEPASSRTHLLHPSSHARKWEETGPTPRPRAALGVLVAAATAALSVAAPPLAGAAGAAPVAYEAEAAEVSQGAVDSDHAGHSVTGYVNFQPVTGAYVEFTVASDRTTGATLDFRYANGTSANRPLDTRVNGALVADDRAFPATGAWTTWRTVTANAALKAGDNTVRVTTAASDGPSLDNLTVTASGPGDTQKPTAPANLRKGKEPTATSVSLAWDAASDDTAVTGYDVYQHGQLMKQVDGTALAATVEGLDPETAYDWTVFARDAAGNVSAASNAVQDPPDRPRRFDSRGQPLRQRRLVPGTPQPAGPRLRLAGPPLAGRVRQQRHGRGQPDPQGR